MDLQAEKLEIMQMILNTEDETIIGKVKSLFKKSGNAIKKKDGLSEFYEGFRQSAREVKLASEGKITLKEARTWLNEIQD